MGVEIISNPLSVSALLSGEIDHHTAAAMRADIDLPPRLSSRRYCASTSPIHFMDSSAVGLVMSL